jgi:hypothetical protein
MDNKYKYGEVLTPKHLVTEIYEILYKNVIYSSASDSDSDTSDGSNSYKNEPLRIFEAGAGHGIFYDTFFDVFSQNDYLKYVMNEINEHDCGDILWKLIEKHNYNNRDFVIFEDFFSLNPNKLNDHYKSKSCCEKMKDCCKKDKDIPKGFNLIIGNLPFHNGGMKQVPSAIKSENNKKGKTIWPQMMKKMINSYLDYNGVGCLVIPCIWLKPDREGVYDIMTNYKILYLKTYTSTEANQLFGYNAQTPLCYVIFKKRENIYQSIKFNLFDNSINDFVSFSLLRKGLCIPTNHAQFIDNMNYKWWANKKYNIENTLARTLIKTCNMNKECIEGKISDWDEDEDKSIYQDGYKIVTGAKLRKRKSNDFDDCRLMGFIGKKPGAYYGIPKIIIAHKRLPWVTLDLTGDLSFYGRDKYCFIFPDMFENPKEKEKMMKLYEFLKQDNVKKFIMGFKIRMSFIEKYMFEYIPDPNI